jgi:HNH endonuclease
MGIEEKRRQDFERFVNRTPTCWLWTGGVNPQGYGAFRVGQVQSGAHRWAYQWAKGPIPQGLQVHHTCHERLCVNPQHLEVVTRRRNLQHRNFAAWQDLDQRIEVTDGERLTITLSPEHSAWVRERVVDSGRSADEIVALAMYRYMARWFGGWARPTLSAAAE